MLLREITIGRSKSCDIYLDPRCRYASNMHATIYYDGNQLMYRDTSSNGTMINNMNVHKRAVPIRRGDIIMIAGKYQLNWNQIDSFFPTTYRPATQMRNVTQAVSESRIQQPVVPQQPNLSRWSWGAFVLSWLWGFFNGCWWMFFVWFGFVILGALLWWVPFMAIILSFAGLCIQILFGVKGTEWAWENRSWSSVADFEQTQKTWNIVGLVFFMIGIAFIILGLVFSASAIMALLSF